MKQITRDSIKNTAIELIRKKGYSSVTINDICDSCGITKPTFYKYAGSKDELVLDLYDTTVKELVSDPYHFIETDSSLEQLLYIFSKLIEDTTAFGYDLFSQMIIANLQDNRHSLDMRDSLTRMGELIIKKAQNKGEIRNMNDPQILYHSLAHLFTGHELKWCISNGESNDFEEFYLGLNAMLDVRDDLRDLYKDYLTKPQNNK
ncbi:TetR/AcrR family transcriptional regulator [Butyrivibrio sp. INlla16]|uniref:TetR/AcrR family transcriptional regulator n=1 Tax=Butyrivibrio sp. INlla16 TaxID=1520807 RepID=UPI000889907C|nr:TetR/AcrR family transcriptional regulator [Butyrivibrio sp. INlla16]SDB56759.1 transcriptional regulator, TetR family [Butyrivibrio sp. INlla16]